MNFRTLLLLPAFFLCCTTAAFAQDLFLQADLRSRFEYRHGFGNLFPDEAEPAAFIAQRSRLNLGYASGKLQTFISVQDVSTWGDTRQILPRDGNDSFSLFQAWARLQLTDYWAVKLGRQVISYDDERIFGELDWAMQGRFHDAMLLKYESAGFLMDFGGAYNQEAQFLTGNTYNIQGFFSYKTMQYAYFKRQWTGGQISFLFLNNGFQKFSVNNEPDGVYNRQTTGSYFKLPAGPVHLSGSAYYQFGKWAPNEDLSAYQFSLAADYKPKSTLYGLGFEMLSGTSANNTRTNNSFFPLFGTNHKFNGFMDYFYVGNHLNSVGLNDLYGKILFNAGRQNSLLIKAHYFASNVSPGAGNENYLGTEADMVLTHRFSNDIIINAGYSHLFPPEHMGSLKGRNHQNTNNWAWAQLTVNPQIFQHSFSKN